MNKERIELWLRDLETTEVAQGTGALETVKNDNVTYNCCLGRACRVAIDNGLEVGINFKPDMGGFLAIFDYHSGLLPESVQDWYGFANSDPVITLTGTNYKEGVSASMANDQLHYSFKQIAAAFRETHNIPKKG